MIIGGAERVAVGAFDKRRAPAARIVTRAGALDLHHVGPEIGQDLPCPRAGQNARKLKNADTGERSGHGEFLLVSTAMSANTLARATVEIHDRRTVKPS